MGEAGMLKWFTIQWRMNQLRSKDPNVRRAAADALVALGTASIAPLIAALANLHGNARDTAAMALVRLGPACVEPLIAVLKSFDWKMRHKAVEILGQLEDARAVELLIATLQDTDKRVRKTAAETLKRIGGESADTILRVLDAVGKKDVPGCVREGGVAVEPLIGALNDSDKGVRRTAAMALAQLGDARAVEPLIATLQDVDKHVSQNAVESLGQLGDARAVEPLIAIVEGSGVYMCKAAANALGQLGDARAVKPLIGALRDFDVSQSAVKALVRLGPASIEPLIAALKDPHNGVRERAAEALGQLGDAVEPLIATLQDSDEHVRQNAVKALGQLGDARAVEPLVGALKDSCNGVRQAAADALKRLRWESADAVLRVIKAIDDEDVAGCVREGAVAINPLIASLKDESVRLHERRGQGKLLGVENVSLMALLKTASTNFLTEQLQEVAALPGRITRSYGCIDYSGCPITRVTGSSGIDLSDLRQLARQELLRRQSAGGNPAPADSAPSQEAQTISVTCSHCQKRFRAAAKHAGRSARCPGCQAPIVIPMK
jgi:HEAT repeat protein